MNEPKVLILMATYNGEKFIKNQIDSILYQTYNNWTLLIHDDGSIDNTPFIIQKYENLYPNRIRVIKDRNIFRSAKENFAYLMQYALENYGNYEYIMFADQDDIWFPTKIELSLKKIQKIENKYGKDKPCLVYTDLIVVDEFLRVLSCSLWKYQKINPKNNTFNRLLVQNVVTGCSVIINKTALELSLPIPKEAVMHDWWLALVVSAFGALDYLKTPTLLYRQHSSNDTGAKDWRILPALQRIFNPEELKNFKKTFLQYREQAQAFYHQYNYILSPNQKEVLLNFINLLNKNPFDRLLTVYKYHFLKSGFIRNLGYLLFRLIY